jgi:hypothetical protein
MGWLDDASGWELTVTIDPDLVRGLGRAVLDASDNPARGCTSSAAGGQRPGFPGFKDPASPPA